MYKHIILSNDNLYTVSLIREEVSPTASYIVYKALVVSNHKLVHYATGILEIGSLATRRLKSSFVASSTC